VVNFHIARKVIFGGAIALTLSTAMSSHVFAQEADAGATYAALLKQIADVKLSTAQKQVYINTQEAKIADLS